MQIPQEEHVRNSQKTQVKKGTQKYSRKYTTCKILQADCYNLRAFSLLEFLPYRVCAGWASAVVHVQVNLLA